MYAVKHIQRFYGSPDKSAPLCGACGEPVLFASRELALQAVALVESRQYELRHNQYGYDLQVVDLGKSRNAAWLAQHRV